MKRPFLRLLCVAVLSSVSFRGEAASLMKTTPLVPPINLTVGPELVDPTGYGDARLQFSWKLPPNGKATAQTAYQIVCASSPEHLEKGDLWDSGWVDSSQSTFVDYHGPTPKSREAIYWRVRIQDQSGRVSPWSETARVEMGLLSNVDWQAKWISLPQEHPKLSKEEAPKYVSPPCPHFRKEFSLEKPVKAARLYLTAHGIVEIQLNGRAVSADILTPGWTDYAKRLTTATWDVTSLLRQGANSLGAILGEGWYAGRVGIAKQTNFYGVTPELMMQLEVTFKDGTQASIRSDDSWKAKTGPIRNSSIWDGEEYDANQELGEWTQPGYPDQAWSAVEAHDLLPTVALSPLSHQPIRPIEEVVPVAITEPKSGVFVFDLGQNLVGVQRIHLPVAKGEPIRMRFSEMLNPDGTLYTANYRSARSTDTYLPSKDGVITWQPRFSWHGFRYLEITGVPKEAKPAKAWVTAVIWHNAMPETGAFVSSHPKLNQLQSNIRWGEKSNFFAVPTEGPQRDERTGATYDALSFALTANYNFNTLAFYEKWCRDLRDAQTPDGGIPVSVPAVCGTNASSGAGDVAVIVPWELYRSFGYRRILEDNFEMMKGWVGYYEHHKETKNLIHSGFSFGDWVQPFPSVKKSPRGDTPYSLISTAYFARCAELVAKAAGVLGKPEEQKHYQALRDRIAAAFAGEFFTPKGVMKSVPQTQTAYLLALGFDLLPEPIRPAALANLKRLILGEAGGNLRTGFLGTPLINPVLTRFGENSVAYGVLFNDRYPGWFFSIDQGATSMWERWNGYSKTEGFNDARMNSFNHYAFGCIGAWMYETVGGLQPETPGYQKIRIAPKPNAPLTHAEARLETPYGVAASGWKVVDGALSMNVVIPPNTKATVLFPAKSKADVRWVNAPSGFKPAWDTENGQARLDDVPPGTHRFTVKRFDYLK